MIVKKTIGIVLSFLLAVGIAVPVSARQPAQPTWETAKNTALDWMLEATPDGPQIGGVVGEWAIRALARAGRVNTDDPWVKTWLDDLDEPDSLASLRRWTDFQRVVLALEALGLDATDFNGRDFVEPFRLFVPSSHRHAMNRTITADIYALIALAAVGEGSRWFLASVYNAQRPDGSWSLNPSLPTSVFDIDITAMALQALAPHYRRGDPLAVRAVERALEWLTAQTFRDAEGTAQMIVALTALGEGYAEEAAYYVSWLLRWYDPELGGFVRPSTPNRINALATVQAAYALTAYQRFLDEK
jgi:hypothetical protein